MRMIDRITKLNIIYPFLKHFFIFIFILGLNSIAFADSGRGQGEVFVFLFLIFTSPFILIVYLIGNYFKTNFLYDLNPSKINKIFLNSLGYSIIELISILILVWMVGKLTDNKNLAFLGYLIVILIFSIGASYIHLKYFERCKTKYLILFTTFHFFLVIISFLIPIVFGLLAISSGKI